MKKHGNHILKKFLIVVLVHKFYVSFNIKKYVLRQLSMPSFTGNNKSTFTETKNMNIIIGKWLPFSVLPFSEKVTEAT